MYYPDLSTYQYCSRINVEGVLNVGWLDDNHDFSIGAISPNVISKLSQILTEKRDILRMRGTHPCKLCKTDQVYLRTPKIERLLGMSEIWIPGKDSVIYAAPSMIYHYITVHNYKPPDVFLVAVEEFDIQSDWDGEHKVDEILGYN